MTGAKGTTPGTPGGVDFSVYPPFHYICFFTDRAFYSFTGKLGILPKRPILLVPSQPASAAGADAGLSPARLSIANSESTLASPTHREEPEFVENPFEDRP